MKAEPVSRDASGILPFAGNLVLAGGSQSADEVVESAVKVAAALAHPLRVKVLLRLIEKQGSANTIAKELRAPINNVNYHLDVLYKRCGLLEIKDKIKRGGTQEIIYRKVDKATIVELLSSVVKPFGDLLLVDKLCTEFFD